MSNLPTLQRVFKNPKEVFESLLSAILSIHPINRETDVKPHLITFISHPIIKDIIRKSDATSHNLELKKIQITLNSLTNAIEDLKKRTSTYNKPSPNYPSKQQRGDTPPKPTHRTFSAAARAGLPNPSLVVELSHLEINAEDRPKPELVCRTLNEGLSKISPPEVQLAAVRWTEKGNLVITGGPATKPQSLLTAAPHICSILSQSLELPSTSFKLQRRANVKWSKIFIHGVPTGVSPGRNAYSQEECHAALAAVNPSYATLPITQKPSWVRPPTSYTSGSVSSLSVAFEDPDGSKLRRLLAGKYLYIFGNRTSVKKWELRQTTETAQNTAKEHPPNCDAHDEKDIESPPNPPPQSS